MDYYESALRKLAIREWWHQCYDPADVDGVNTKRRVHRLEGLFEDWKKLHLPLSDWHTRGVRASGRGRANIANLDYSCWQDAWIDRLEKELKQEDRNA